MPTSDPGFPAGSVIVVPFPYTDRLAEKRRPAVVVSGPEVARSGYVWIAMITSARNAPMPGDLPIRDLPATGLTVASLVRRVKLACIEPVRILRRIGALADAEAEAVHARLRAWIGPSSDPT